MGWPYNADPEAIVAGTTTIKKSWGDTVVAVIRSLASGTRNLLGSVYSRTEGTTTRPGSGKAQPFVYYPDDPGATDKVLMDLVAIHGGRFFRRYQCAGKIEETINAVWDNTGLVWTSDDDTFNSSLIIISGPDVQIRWRGAAAGTWTAGVGVGAWDKRIQLTTSSGSITADNNVTATAGNVEAGGAPVGSAGPGLAKCHRLYSTGALHGATDFANNANWGGAGQTFTPSVTSTDMAGDVAVTAGAAPAADPIFVLTFKEGTFTNTPNVVVGYRGTDDNALVPPFAGVTWTVTATALTVTLRTGGVNPTAGKVYRFSWVVVGY